MLLFQAGGQPERETRAKLQVPTCTCNKRASPSNKAPGGLGFYKANVID